MCRQLHTLRRMDDWARPNRDYHDGVVARYEDIVRPDWLPDSVYRFRAALGPVLQSLPRDARILEIGCGPGDFCRELYALGFRNIHALDIAPAMVIQTSQELPGICALVGDATMLPYTDDAFDFINVKGCYHHVSGVTDAIGEFARCLKPGGRFRLQEPNAASLFAEALMESDIERPLDIAEVERYLTGNGLTIESRTTYLHFGMARQLSEAGLDKPAMDAVIDALNPVFDHAGQGEIFMIIGRKPATI